MTTLERRHDTILALAATALDFGLSRAESAELGAHLADCPACARTAGALRADAAVLRHPAELRPGRRVDAAVAAAIAGRTTRAAPQRLLVLVAATALLLVALLGVAAAGALLQRSRPAVVVPVPTPPVVAPYPSGSPAPTAGPTWRQGSIPPMFTGSTALPASIAAAPSGFALVGGREFSDTKTPAGGTAGAWRSPDGVAWEHATPVDTLAVGNDVMVDEPVPGLLDVAWGSAGYTASGLLLEGGQQVGGAWVSNDGRAWSRAQLPNQVLARPAAIAWTGSGYVMVGVSRDTSAPRAAVWLSPDGRSWQRVPDAVAFDIGGYFMTLGSAGSGGLADVAALADGSLVAVGRSCTGTTTDAARWQQPVCRPLVLRSPDGQTWTRAYAPAAGGAGLSAVAASGSIVVAVAGGQGASTDSAALVVGDAKGWRAVDAPGVPRLDRVAAFGGGFLALSTATAKVTLWTSPDGVAWTEIPDVPPPADVTGLRDVDLAVAGDQVVIAGWAEVNSPAGTAFSIVGQNLPLPQAASGPAPSAMPTAISTPDPGLLPSSGAVRITPGPDRGLYVVVNGTASGSVVALLDAAGSLRAGLADPAERLELRLRERAADARGGRRRVAATRVLLGGRLERWRDRRRRGRLPSTPPARSSRAGRSPCRPMSGSSRASSATDWSSLPTRAPTRTRTPAPTSSSPWRPTGRSRRAPGSSSPRRHPCGPSSSDRTVSRTASLVARSRRSTWAGRARVGPSRSPATRRRPPSTPPAGSSSAWPRAPEDHAW